MLCKKATEKYSGDVSDLVVVSDIIGEEAAAGKTVSTRNYHRNILIWLIGC